MTGPLHGVRVLDLSRVLSGPFCTMLLADLGAEVVKVEQPGKGDPARHLGPRVDDDSAYFVSVNRGKQSITVDLSAEAGQRLLRDLLPRCDVLVENFIPGTMARLGLDYARVSDANPSLVYVSISGFGQDGPYARRPALDIVVQAMGGMMSVTGEPGGPPLRPGASLGDSVAGTFAALAIVSALFQRRETGRGQYIDLSMLDCQITLLENAFARYFATGEVPGPLGSRHPVATPFQAFRAADGYFVVALLTDDPQTWSRFCEAIGRADLAEDHRFLDNAGRTLHLAELGPALERTFQAKPMAWWIEVLTGAGVPCGPVNSVATAAEDAQVRHRGMLATIPRRAAGEWRVANTPFRLAGAPTGPAGPSPRLGEHTEEVLSRLLGLGAGEVERLREAGVV